MIAPYGTPNSRLLSHTAAVTPKNTEQGIYCNISLSDKREGAHILCPSKFSSLQVVQNFVLHYVSWVAGEDKGYHNEICLGRFVYH